MIESITITNHLDESLELVLTEPEKSGIIIRSIDGLGPAKANMHLTDLATIDGGIDNGAKLDTRNIVLSLLFLKNPTIEDTRLKTYKYFPIKQNITFKIKTDNRECYTIGRVESNTPNIFDRDEGCQISIICPDPYFYNVEDDDVIFFADNASFEFPFSNESIVQNSRNLLINNLLTFRLNGIDITVNNDRTLRIRGTVTRHDAEICVGYLLLGYDDNGAYSLTGCPRDGSTSTYCMFLYKYIEGRVYQDKYDTGSGAIYNIDVASGTSTRFEVHILIKKGQTVDFTYEPVLRKAYFVDNAYIEVGPNLLNSNELSYQFGSVRATRTTVTVGTDGRIKTTGYIEDDMDLSIGDIVNLTDDEEYILSGCPSGGGSDTYQLEILNAANEVQYADTGSGVTFTKDNYINCNHVNLHLVQNTSQSVNYTFEPMIRYSSDTDPTYEPYSYATDSGPKLEFGEIATIAGGNIFYEGDSSDVGVKIEIHANGPASGISIYDMSTSEVMAISSTRLVALTGSDIVSGDTILIDTNKGRKSIRLLRNGNHINILNTLDAPIAWFKLRQGDNSFIFDAENGLANLQYKMSFTKVYEGV